MNNIKFNRTHKILTDEEILKQKPDFDALIKMNPVKVPHKSFMNNKWWFMGGGSAVIVGIVLSIVFSSSLKKQGEKFFNTNKKNQIDSLIVDEKSGATVYVDSASALGEDEYEINSSKKSIISTKSGTLIEIPANSFVDKMGKDVNSNVRIHYKDYYKPYDIYNSGISMQYDSAGKTYSFESAGMFDIQASAGNEEVYLKPGKSLSVSLVTSSNDSRFNFYYWDKKKGWEYAGKPKIRPFTYYAENESQKELYYSKYNESALKSKTSGKNKTKEGGFQSGDKGPDFISKKEVSGVYYAYNVDVDLRKFPKLLELFNINRRKEGKSEYKQGRYERMQFYIPSEDIHYTSKIFNTTWLQIRLTDMVGYNRYRMKFRSKDSTIYEDVEPILRNNDSVYFVSKRQKSKEELAEAKRLDEIRKKWQKITNEMIEKFVKAINVYPKGVCKIEIYRLGLCNLDRPWLRLRSYLCKYYDEKDKELKSGMVYAYNSAKKTVEKYTSLTSFVSFYGGDPYVLWLVDKKSIHITTINNPNQHFGDKGVDKKVNLKTYSTKDGLAVLKELMWVDNKGKS